MKHILALLFLLVTGLGSVFAQNPLPNPSFENWSGGKPVGWQYSTGVSIDSPGHSGQYAVKGVTDGSNVPSLALGPNTGDGISMTQSYNYLNFYYKFNRLGDEYLVASIEMQDGSGQGTTAASGYAEITAQSSVFKAYSLPIMNYYPPAMCQIEFGMGANNNLVSGSSIEIDDVSLSSSPIADIGDEAFVNAPANFLYPNPTGQYLNIRHLDGAQAFIRVYNAEGRLVDEMMQPQNDRLDVSGLVPGYYIAEFTMADIVERFKFVKQ